jgi:hypothetical protein
MTTYARIDKGVIAELFTPPSGVPITECFHDGLQWEDCTGSPNVAPGWTYANGTYAPPLAPPPPTLAQQAAAMLAGGIRIVSTATPALNGTYPCDVDAGNQDGNTLSAITAGLSFPGGTIVRLDTSGTRHAFTVADFKNLCQEKIDFEQTLNTIIGGGPGALPTLPVSIA